MASLLASSPPPAPALPPLLENSVFCCCPPSPVLCNLGAGDPFLAPRILQKAPHLTPKGVISLRHRVLPSAYHRPAVHPVTAARWARGRECGTEGFTGGQPLPTSPVPSSPPGPQTCTLRPAKPKPCWGDSQPTGPTQTTTNTCYWSSPSLEAPTSHPLVYSFSLPGRRSYTYGFLPLTTFPGTF